MRIERDHLTPENEMLKTEWAFGGVTYGFSYPITRAWARWYLREREGIDV